MDSFYFTKDIPGNRQLCIAQLTNRRIAQSADEIADVSGYFLYELDGEGDRASVRVLAKIHSEDAALELRAMFGMA